MKREMISVVISVLNGGKTFEGCIKSVIEQDYQPIEIVIIDGGSVDNTIDVIDKYRKYISYSVSEQDTGIYSAWNKALRVVNGTWVCFIGSDDRFAAKESLSELAYIAYYPQINYSTGRVGVTNLKGEHIRVVGRRFVRRELEKGMRFAHPGSLHHISLFHEHGLFNEDYKISGDYEFFLRCGDAINAAFTDKIVVVMSDGGVSNARVYEGLYEGYKAIRGAKIHSGFVAARFLLISSLKVSVRRLISAVNWKIRRS